MATRGLFFLSPSPGEISGGRREGRRYSGGMKRAWTALLLLGLGCIEGPPAGPGKPGKIGRIFGGTDNADLVADPVRVEAFRLRPPSAVVDVKPQYNEWPLAGGRVRVPADVAARLSNALTREGTYGGDEPKGCDPSPGFMLRFHGDGRTVDVVFCFECAVLFTYRGSRPLWYANFDGSTKMLAVLLLKLFPGDPDLAKFAEAP